MFEGTDSYLSDLMRSKGEDDVVIERQISKVLFQERMIAPWIRAIRRRTRFFVNLWEAVHGKYRKTFKKVRGSANAPPGAGAGAGGFSAPPAWTAAVAAGAGILASTQISQSQPIEDAGIRAGEVVAYRCWLLLDGFLYSAAISDFKWEPGKPAEGDPTQVGHGVHGFKSRLKACDYIDDFECRGDIVVSGTVDLWGDVFEHEWGYRASYAAIASIDDSPNYDAAALRKLYKLNRRNKKRKASDE